MGGLRLCLCGDKLKKRHPSPVGERFTYKRLGNGQRELLGGYRSGKIGMATRISMEANKVPMGTLLVMSFIRHPGWGLRPCQRPGWGLGPCRWGSLGRLRVVRLGRQRVVRLGRQRVVRGSGLGLSGSGPGSPVSGKLGPPAWPTRCGRHGSVLLKLLLSSRLAIFASCIW